MSFTDDQDIIDYFTQGQCNALAYEIHKLTGWTLAVVSDEPAGNDDYIGHVFVIDSNGMAIDIKGRRSVEDMQSEWWFAFHIHRFFSRKEFEHEMILWENTVRYDRDRKAKHWAKVIVDLLEDNFA